MWRWLRTLLILAQLVSLCWLPAMWLGATRQRRRAGAAAGGHCRADLAVNQSTFACLFSLRKNNGTFGEPAPNQR
ncbi:hypothetical protein KCP69_10565 [Salmonella enterica subsp. enterica]|nr:hypothetical protein KCP69_10565 [Salmonella enterica subsp. enterica]